MVRWPEWWSWEVELSPHVLKRMIDRGFNEADVRTMLHDAVGYRMDIEKDRWIVESRHRKRRWEIVLEPIEEENVLLVVTAYAVE